MQRTNIEDMLDILRCPMTGSELRYDEKLNAFVSLKGNNIYRIENGIPNFCHAEKLPAENTMPDELEKGEPRNSKAFETMDVDLKNAKKNLDSANSEVINSEEDLSGGDQG